MADEVNEVEAALQELPDYFSRIPGTLATKIAAYRKFVNGSSNPQKLLERGDRESKLACLLATELFKYDGGKFHSSLTFDQEANEWKVPEQA